MVTLMVVVSLGSISCMIVAGNLPSKVPIGWLYLPAVGGANMSAYAPFSLAMKALHADGVLPKDVELDIRWYYFECDAYNGSIGFIDLIMKHNITGLIGPPCSMTGDVIGRLAVSWNILLISQKIESSLFDDKSLYQTLARTVLTSTKQISEALVRLMIEFKWHQMAIIYKPGYFTDLLYSAVKSVLIDNDIQINADVIYSVDATPEHIDSYLKIIKRRARIVLIVVGMDFSGSEDLMLQAYRNNMTNSDYVWLLCQLEVPVDGVPPWENKSPKAAELKLAYRSLKTIYPSAYEPNKLRPFRELVKAEYAELYPERDPNDYEFTQLQAALFDSLYAYGYVLNLSQSAGVAYNDGKGLFNLLRLQKIKGATAPVIFDINVERAPTYTVTDFDEYYNWTQCIEIDRILNLTTSEYDYHVVYERKMYWRTANNVPPMDIPLCGFDGSRCVVTDKTTMYIAIPCSIIGVGAVIVLTYFYRKRSLEKELLNMNWQIDHTQLIEDTKRANTPQSGFSNNSSGSGSRPESKGGTSTLMGMPNYHDRLLTGKYQGEHCHIFKYDTRREVRLNMDQLKILKALKSLNHESLSVFIGMSLISDEVLIIWGCSSGRTLRDLLSNESMVLDDDFLATFLRGATSGLKYLHHSTLGVHGFLTSQTCAVDSRLVLKMSDYGMAPLCSPIVKAGLIKMEREDYDLYHCAPEIITEMAMGGNAGSKQADIYSLAMIFYQIISRKDIFFDFKGTEEALLARIQDTSRLPMRPTLTDDISMTWIGAIGLIKQCWTHDPVSRPTIDMVNSAIAVICSPFHGNVIEKMIRRMERYTNDLEKVVNERTAEVHAQQERTERLLQQMLPKSVADRLQAGIAVQPETFESATILFTDIVRFTDMSAKHTAIEIVSLLNEIYSNFDAIIDKHDVYKVETIGDSYMVVSGLPRKTELHAFEIASLGLGLRDYIRSYLIPFMDEEPLRIRIGAHSGSVATGVVGAKMPRYCLFGDTVNTASRMESNGIPMRLHVTEACKVLLAKHAEFEVVPRGEIEIKGKGTITTYFIERKFR